MPAAHRPDSEEDRQKTYCITDAPIEIYGLDVIDAESKHFWRLADEESKTVSDFIRDRSKTAFGGRVRFRTNARELTIKMELHTLYPIPVSPSAAPAAQM